jgi:L-rhamnose-H+ transport protein
MSEFTLSIILILFAGFFQGTFGLGMKKFAPLAWEAYWLVFSIIGMLCIPIIWASITVPNVTAAIFSVPTSTLLLAVVFGACWGVGAIMFGLAVNYIGMSIAYGISMGLAAAVGSLVPLARIPNIGANPAVPLIITGVIVMVVGVGIITVAGVLRDKIQMGEGKAIAAIKQGKLFRIGLLFAILNGVFAALLNVGFTYAFPAAKAAVAQGALPRNASLVAWVVVLFGGVIVNVVYAVYLLVKNNSMKTYSTQGASKGIIWALLTAILWFAALGVYGQGAALMGEFGPAIGWTMFLALALVISNGWGIGGGEWKGVPRAFTILMIGNVVLIISWIILGYANSLV